MNCQNKFGNSPTGNWFVDPSSSCCFAERTSGEKKSGGFGSPANTLNIKCSDGVASGTSTQTYELPETASPPLPETVRVEIKVQNQAGSWIYNVKVEFVGITFKQTSSTNEQGIGIANVPTSEDITVVVDGQENYEVMPYETQILRLTTRFTKPTTKTFTVRSNSNSGRVPCSQTGSTGICNVKSECPISGIECIDNIRYRVCSQNSGGLLQGVKINPYYQYGSLSACSVGEICEINKCVGDSDKDGVSDSKDKCPSSPLAQKVDSFGCIPTCGTDEVKLVDGTCKKVVQTCIDNNLNNICDADDPIVWADPSNNVPICADRNSDRICDGVEGLFCKDSNNNKICDSDEVKWLATYCLDENGNGICDGIENTKAVCNKNIQPVCDPLTNITYPNDCFAKSFSVPTYTEGSCKVSPVIIRIDCSTGDVPVPSGYICDPETGWLFKRDTIYQNITIDCRNSATLDEFSCTQVGESWVWTRTQLVNIDCYSRGCPKPNQLCQGGICVESVKRCPSEIDCKSSFGADSRCDDETGLCTKLQYKLITPPTTITTETIFNAPKTDFTQLGIILSIAAGAYIVLKLAGLL